MTALSLTLDPAVDDDWETHQEQRSARKYDTEECMRCGRPFIPDTEEWSGKRRSQTPPTPTGKSPPSSPLPPENAKKQRKCKTGFEKDQKKYDKLFEYEAKKVVHTLPRLSKDEVDLLEALKAEARSTPEPEPKPKVVEPKPCSVDMDSLWLYGFV